MHELSIALSILDVVAETAVRQSGHVVAVHLKLGPLSGVVKAPLVSAYALAREGTPLAQSELVVEEVPIVAHCSACASDRTLPSMQELTCPVCGSPASQIVSGRELDVVALEIEA
jgi:hydrogenase nickel incorporation protein HypA/HybF